MTGDEARQILDEAQAAAARQRIADRDEMQRMADCTCLQNCGEGDACADQQPGLGFVHHTLEAGCTACSRIGEWHAHDTDPCPLHPELTS